MEKVRPWCDQLSDRGRLTNRTEQDMYRIKRTHTPVGIVADFVSIARFTSHQKYRVPLSIQLSRIYFYRATHV